MIFIHQLALAVPFLILLGGLGGFLVVPMNALLQHRGHNLMGAGRSIAVQNFNEQAAILGMGAFTTSPAAWGCRLWRHHRLWPAGGRHHVAHWPLDGPQHALPPRREMARLLGIARRDDH